MARPQPPVDVKDPPPVKKPPREPEPPLARLTISDIVVYQKAGEQPQSSTHRFERVSKVVGEPQPLPVMEVGDRWVPLDLASKWPSVAQVKITNLMPPTTRIRSPQEWAEVMNKTLEVGYGPSPEAEELVDPGETQRFHWRDPSRVRLRCAAGTTRIQIIVFPG